MRKFGMGASQETGHIRGTHRITDAPDRRQSFLKYKFERRPVACVAAVFVLRPVIWALATPLVCAINVNPI